MAMVITIIILPYIDLPDTETTQNRLQKKPRVDQNRGFLFVADLSCSLLL